jgi:hypothetical protein
MLRRLHQFCEDIRLHIAAVETSIERIAANAEDRAYRAEVEVRARLDAMRRQAEQSRAQMDAAAAQFGAWADAKMGESSESIAQWRMNGNVAALRDRAERAERGFAAAADLAKAALDRAEASALEAWLARQDVDIARRIASGDIG